MSKTANSIQTKVVTITPSEAHKLLANNTSNRNLRPAKVLVYAGAIQRGEWELNGDAIRVARDGTLLDGQHRLHAVIKAGVPIQTILITGLESSTQETMDIGTKRTLGDMLRLRGEKNTPRLAGAINLIYTYSKVGKIDPKGFNTSQAPTTQQLIRFFEENQEIREYMHPPHGTTVSRLLTPSSSSALWYLFSLVSREDADLFFEYLSTGNALARTDPIFVLRERLMKERAKSLGQISPLVRNALTVKAFNHWRAGTSVQNLRWVGGGASGTPFPRIHDCPMIPESDRK